VQSKFQSLRDSPIWLPSCLSRRRWIWWRFEKPCPARILARFSQPETRRFLAIPRNHAAQSRMKSWKSAPSKDCRPIQEFTVAPFAQHSPVNELHSIESKAFRFSFFLLTQKIEGVKHNCSLTVSEVFPVGAASGGQTRSPSADCQSANAREVGQPANHAYRAPAG